jgi:hypothetical protein
MTELGQSSAGYLLDEPAAALQDARHHMAVPGGGDSVPRLRAPAAQPCAHMLERAVSHASSCGVWHQHSAAGRQCRCAAAAATGYQGPAWVPRATLGE